MNVFQVVNIPADAASAIPLSTAGAANTIRYLDGPQRIIVTFTDSRDRAYRVPLSPGDQFTLDGDRIFDRIEIINLDSVVGRADLLIGRGALVSNGSFAGSTEAPRMVTFSRGLAAVVTKYAVVGINNPSSSRYACEVSRITLYPNSTDYLNLALITIDVAAMQAGASPYSPSVLGTLRLNDYSNGTSELQSITNQSAVGVTPDIMAVINGGTSYKYFESTGNGAAGQIVPTIYDLSDTPITVRPGQHLVVWSSATNVSISGTFQFTERRIA